MVDVLDMLRPDREQRRSRFSWVTLSDGQSIEPNMGGRISNAGGAPTAVAGYINWSMMATFHPEANIPTIAKPSGTPARYGSGVNRHRA